MLDEYIKTVQGWIRDRAQREMNIEDIRHYVNRARREIALRTQCIRILTPIQGQITSIQVTHPGSGYTAPTVAISAPDSPSGRPEGLGGSLGPAGTQATATAMVVGGQIAGIGVNSGGDGYLIPSVTITDPHGTGATAVANVTPISVTQGAQEVYLFSSAPLQAFPGVGSVFAVKSISFIYSNYRYSIPVYPFSIYQAYIRQFPLQYQYIPTMAAQYSWGTTGSLYMYPIPSSLFAMEWDCFCLPQELSDDLQTEAIPQPWTDAVPIGAVVYAFEEMQSYNNARYWQQKFDTYVGRYSMAARPGRMTNPYGRF